MKESRLISLANHFLIHARLIFWLPILFFVVFFTIKCIMPEGYLYLIQEDGVLETMQLLFFVIATCMAFQVMRLLVSRKRLFAAILWGLFALACFFISMEEISWGQRFLSSATTVDKSINLQGETNLHNHKHLQIWFALAYLLIGLVGSAGIRVFKQLSWLLPSKVLLWYFLPVFIFNLHMLIGAGVASDVGVTWLVPVRDLHDPRLLLYKDQEVIEVLLALGFYLHACWVAASLVKESA